jgi:hypothetical protein
MEIAEVLFSLVPKSSETYDPEKFLACLCAISGHACVPSNQLGGGGRGRERS